MINSSGQLDEFLLYQRGFNTHFFIGKAFLFNQNNKTGIYVTTGIGYIQYKIRIETDRTNLPQISGDYIKGYDNFTNGVSNKTCLNYMYFDKKNSMHFYLSAEIIHALTKNNRPYNFGNMEYNNDSYNIDKLFGLKFGIIIPINRRSEERFHYF